MVKNGWSLLDANRAGAAASLPTGSEFAPTIWRAIGDLAAREHWPLEELHTEEGRLDEVFRSITLPDTKPAK